MVLTSQQELCCLLCLLRLRCPFHKTPVAASVMLKATPAEGAALGPCVNPGQPCTLVWFCWEEGLFSRGLS